ncbi:MAG: hypothetical protein KDN19_01110 [Verrucomicrobiae bacterium]|nr:hypothetical protein [Verrucomicrobiae bacterium]
MNFSISSFRLLLFGLGTGFSLTIALFFGSSEFVVRKKVIPNENFLDHLKLLQAGVPKAIVLGDSYLANGFIGAPGYLNLAYPANNIHDIKYEFDKIRDLSRLQVVVLQASPALLKTNESSRSSRALDNVGYHLHEYLGFYSLLPNFRPYLINYLKMAARGKRFSRKTELNEFGAQIHDSVMSPSSLGFSLEVQQAVARTVPRRSRDQNSKAYREFVERLAEESISVYLVVPPTSEYYLEQAGEMSGYAECSAFFRQLSSQTGFPLLDYSGSFTDPLLYHSCDHLNREGAVRFTDDLIATIEKSQSLVENPYHE